MGDGSHGSVGYVLVLTKSNDFVWLLFDEINPIEKILVQNGMIYAKNNCDELFILPIDEPFKYRIENKEQL